MILLKNLSSNITPKFGLIVILAWSSHVPADQYATAHKATPDLNWTSGNPKVYVPTPI